MKEKPFSEQVIKAILSIPKGKIATYGQIAALAGKPHGSRGVAWILHSSSTRYRLPWQRVVNAQGKISFPKAASNYLRQKRLLEKEGIEFSEAGVINLKKFQWKKKAVAIKPVNRPRLFSSK